MLMGVVALVASALYFLDVWGVVAVDEAVALVTVWVALALVGLLRAVLRLRDRLSG
jgi:hypothetical protein